ncbi:MAG: long-chain fatty acid--CoA ligase, partial [Thiohalomonadaceae bacterium]
SGLSVVDVYTSDRFLSFLPLSHALERTAGYYLPMAAGAQVVFARSVAVLAEDLASQRPTLLIAVPRIFERVHGRIEAQLARASHARRRLFETTVRIGWSRFLHAQGRGPWRPSHMLWPLLDALVARKVRARLGGRLRLVVSGGAPLAAEVARVFIGLGVPVLQGYGLTETAPQLSVNLPHDNDPASVGPPLPGVEIRLGENDELLVRSPGMTRGYWNNPEASAQLLRGGWLHTGDQARLEHGRIYITGRIKDVLVLSNGEKVPPEEMELAMALDPLIEQVLVVGEGCPYLAALAVLNEETWQGVARRLELDPDAPESLVDRRVAQDVLHRMNARLHAFPAWAKIRRVHLTRTAWSVDNGLLTPTLKKKRAELRKRFAAEIAALYADGPAQERHHHRTEHA